MKHLSRVRTLSRSVQVIVVQHLLTDSLGPDQPLSLVNQIITPPFVPQILLDKHRSCLKGNKVEFKKTQITALL